MKPGYFSAALIETKLMVEFLAPLDVRPDWKDAVWVANVPCGPDPKGIRLLQAFQEHYGVVNVTTADASKGTRGDFCGVYVREDVLEASPNPLLDYLSRSGESLTELDGWRVGDVVTVMNGRTVGTIKRIDPTHGLGRWPFLVAFASGGGFSWSAGDWLTKVPPAPLLARSDDTPSRGRSVPSRDSSKEAK